MKKVRKGIVFCIAVCCLFRMTGLFFTGEKILTVRAAQINPDEAEGQEENDGILDGENAENQNRHPDGEEEQALFENEPAGEFVSAEGEIAWGETLRVLMRARVRSAPSVTAETVGTLEGETMVPAIGKLNDENGELWYHIRPEDPALEGYIKASLVEETGEMTGNDGMDEENPEEVDIPVRTIRVNMESTYTLDGSDHLTKQAQTVQAMAGAGTIPEQKSNISKILSSIYAVVDRNLVIITVLAVVSVFMLYRIYGRLMTEVVGDPSFLKKKEKKHKKAKRKYRNGSDRSAHFLRRT